MKVTVVEKSPVERTLEVTVEKGRVEKAYDRAFSQMARNLSIPGFRKGKVPAQIARRYITDDGLTGNVLEGLLPQAYREALVEVQVTPLSEPRWEIVQKERGQDLVFKATFEVKPQIEVKDYQGAEVTQVRPEVGDDHVDKLLNDYRQAHARLATVTEDRGVFEDDIALVDYTGTHEGEAIGAAQNYLMEIKSDAYIPGFMQNLHGLKPGEERHFEANFPADYHNAELAGKQVSFHFKLHEIKVRQLPELDDEFAKTISDFETLDALKADMLHRMRENVVHRTRREAGSQILFGLLSQVRPEQVPAALVKYRAGLVFRGLDQQLEKQGKSLEQYIAEQGTDRDSLLNQVAGQGALEARIELLVDGIARQEGLEVSLAEVRAQIAESAAAHQVSPTEMEARMVQEGTFEVVRYNLLQTKVVEWLADNGKVRYLTPEQAEQEAARAKAAAAEKAAQETAAEAPQAETAEAQPEAPAPKKSRAKAQPAPEAAVPEEPAGEPEEGAKKPRSRAKKAKEEG
ncbi:MAG: trigger factor [Candidatus Eremiobacterota bacterium]